jgi:hypothetical protein
MLAFFGLLVLLFLLIIVGPVSAFEHVDRMPVLAGMWRGLGTIVLDSALP